MSWSAAHKHFLRWCRAGTWTKVLTAIHGEVGTRSGRRRRPTAAVVDSSSVKASPIAHVRVDKGYTGSTVADAAKAVVTVDVVSGPKTRLWVHRPAATLDVERTNGWINHRRRWDRHCESHLDAHEGFLILSQIALLLRRLDRTQLFDKLQMRISAPPDTESHR